MAEHRYEVYGTRYDAPGIVEELVPARNLSFSMPLSDHGDASFEATVEPGKSFWRPSIGLPISGILIARDGVPVWSGWVTDEDQTGERTFSFQCKEWGAFFEEKVPAVPWVYTDINDGLMFRHMIDQAQLIAGQNLQIQTGSYLGAASSTRAINSWDDTTVGREFRSVSEAIDGPEWYFATGGTLANPVRQLTLGDRLGHTSAQTVLEWVADTEDYQLPEGPPVVTLLGSLFPGPAPVVPARRAGGNLIAAKRRQSTADAATVAKATGAGEEAARLVATARSDRLLNAGWPRMTTTKSYSDVTIPATLQSHADADLAATAGIATTYQLVSLDDDPDWTQTPRGSSVRVILDTDVYGAERPVGGGQGFVSRLLDTVVRVPDSGPAQVEWVTAVVQEV